MFHYNLSNSCPLEIEFGICLCLVFRTEIITKHNKTTITNTKIVAVIDILIIVGSISLGGPENWKREFSCS